jgi:hypothetical protein
LATVTASGFQGECLVSRVKVAGRVSGVGPAGLPSRVTVAPSGLVLMVISFSVVSGARVMVSSRIFSLVFQVAVSVW